MKSIIFLFFFFSSFYLLNAVIPNWDVTKVGDNRMTSSEYNYTVYDGYWNKVHLILKIRYENKNGVMTKTNFLRMSGETEGNPPNVYERIVDFDRIGNFYHLNKRYYVCPKGKFHLYDYTGGGPVEPKEFKDGNANSDFDFRCVYHVESSVFLAFYLINGEYSIYKVYIKDCADINTMNNGGQHIGQELYDYKLAQGGGNNGEYLMMALNKQNKIIRLSPIKATLKSDYQGVSEAGSDKKVANISKFVQASFKSESDQYKNDFFYFTYDDLSNFKSGYSTKAASSYDLVTDVEVSENQTAAHFEFFEDMEIKEISFIGENRFVYYKLKIKDTNTIKYYGIFDTKLNKVIFNTDQKLFDFVPYKAKAMLAVMNGKAYKICPIKGSSDCVDYCDNDLYHFDLDGNTCGSQTCQNGKVLLVPSNICNSTCDTTYYVEKNGQCGLCKYFDPNNFKFKLIGSTGCINETKNTMVPFNGALGLYKCADGYILKNNICTNDYKCPQNCLRCETETKCTECNQGFLLENNLCVEHCSEGYGKDSTGKECKDCEDNACSNFESETCNCESCKENFFLNSNKKCDKCDDTCQNCSVIATNCTSCGQNDFFVDNKCYPCQNPNCSIKESDGCKCSQCHEGFFVKNYICESCIKDCKFCEDSSSCKECKEHFYYKESEKKCEACPTNCNKTKSDNCLCETCKEGFFMNSSETCQQCNTECKTCENNEGYCTSCLQENYFANEGKCIECDKQCKTCSGNKDRCTSCKDREYLNKENNTCQSCSDICDNCSGMDDKCLSCREDSEYPYLIFDDYNQTCVNSCKENGRELVDESFICKPKYKTNSTGNGEETKENESNVDYLLWIFVGVVGVLLIVITICICIKCCSSKADDEFLEQEKSSELTDKVEDEEKGELSKSIN